MASRRLPILASLHAILSTHSLCLHVAGITSLDNETHNDSSSPHTVHVLCCTSLHELQYIWGWAGTDDDLLAAAARVSLFYKTTSPWLGDSLVLPLYDACVSSSKCEVLRAAILRHLDEQFQSQSQDMFTEFARKWMMDSIAGIRSLFDYFSSLSKFLFLKGIRIYKGYHNHINIDILIADEFSSRENL